VSVCRLRVKGDTRAYPLARDVRIDEEVQRRSSVSTQPNDAAAPASLVFQVHISAYMSLLWRNYNSAEFRFQFRSDVSLYFRLNIWFRPNVQATFGGLSFSAESRSLTVDRFYSFENSY